ncbi:unnamed protein product [Polarella glacialis]|uniref:EF-hand domain-containing protein n=1 Tax=Polarella glacialis TaxID=89957 RepID=A0A813K971_POLGL|nr:unnamed protein product [Polarella glacialis]
MRLAEDTPQVHAGDHTTPAEQFVQQPPQQTGQHPGQHHAQQPVQMPVQLPVQLPAQQQQQQQQQLQQQQQTMLQRSVLQFPQMQPVLQSAVLRTSSTPPARGFHSPESLFDMLDINRDGFLSREEFYAAQAAMALSRSSSHMPPHSLPVGTVNGVDHMNLNAGYSGKVSPPVSPVRILQPQPGPAISGGSYVQAASVAMNSGRWTGPLLQTVVGADAAHISSSQQSACFDLNSSARSDLMPTGSSDLASVGPRGPCLQ